MSTVPNTNINNNFNHLPGGALSGNNGLLIFEINNFEFCIGLHGVKDIIKFTEADPVSRDRVTSEIIAGDARYTLVNIHGLLEFPTVYFGSDSRLILIDVFTKRFGFIVDKVIEIISTDGLFGDDALDYAIPEENKQRFNGVLKYHNRRIIVLNLEKITRDFDKFIEFPRKIKTYEYVNDEIKNKLKNVMGIS